MRRHALPRREQAELAVELVDLAFCMVSAFSPLQLFSKIDDKFSKLSAIFSKCWQMLTSVSNVNKCKWNGPSYQPPRPSKLPVQTLSEIQNRNTMQYQNSASFEELAKSPHGLQRKQATAGLIFADAWQPNRKGWRKYHSSLPTYFFFLKIFGAQGTAPSSLDSFTQLVMNSSNFYARFRKRFRPSIWPCLVFSELVLKASARKKKKKRRKKKKTRFFFCSSKLNVSSFAQHFGQSSGFV